MVIAKVGSMTCKHLQTIRLIASYDIEQLTIQTRTDHYCNIQHWVTTLPTIYSAISF